MKCTYQRLSGKCDRNNTNFTEVKQKALEFKIPVPFVYGFNFRGNIFVRFSHSHRVCENKYLHG